MIVLNSTTQVLRARLAGAPATTNPTFSFTWGDDASPVALGNTRGVLNGTTNVSLVTSPAASVSRVIRSGFLYNADSASVQVTLEHYDGTTAEAIGVITLGPGYTLSLDDGGFQVTDTSGALQTAGASGSGTVTSVAMTVPSWLTVAGSPVTHSGTLAVTATSALTANQVLATPDGSSGALAVRSLVATDVPTLNQSTTGNAGTATALQTPRTINGVSFDGSANIVVALPPPVNAQTGTTYTLALTDAPANNASQGIVTMNNAAANTLTVPPNSSVAFPVGTIIQVVQLGAGQTAIAAGAGVTINNSSSLTARVRYSTMLLTQVAANVWVLSGDLT